MIPVDGGSAPIDPFGIACGTYRQRGWLGTIPLPAGRKFPPPTGWTGRSAEYPSIEQIAKWMDSTKYDNANIALHLGVTPSGEHEVVGIDVDDYGDKRGAKQLKELEAEHGDLPATWISTSRALPSGIRFFLVPVGYSFIGKAGSAIDIIQRAHRYAVVAPSWNPDSGGRYTWRNPDGHETDKIPSVDDLPMLPDAWFEFLTRGGLRDEGAVPIDMSSTDGEIEQWVDSALPKSEKQPCERMQKALDKWLTAIADGESSHDKITGAHWELVHLATEGHHGLVPAMEAVGDAYVKDTLRRGKRGMDELKGEVGRSFWSALRKAKARMGEFVAPACPCPPRRDKDAQASASRSLAGVNPVPIRWLWKCFLPLGKVAILEGDPDVGKSTVTLDWAATVSTGRAWPDSVIGEQTLVSQDDPAGVLLVGAEDDYADTVVPRLIVAGADLNRVHALNRPVDFDGNPVPFTIPTDIDWLRQAVRECGARLVIIDPITACLPENTRHGVDAEIRRILQHIADLAAEMDCAVVLIRHFNKAAGMSAKHRGGGSIAYTAVVRSVLSVAALTEPGPTGEMFALARTKGNLSPPPKTLGYSLVKAPTHPDLPEQLDPELGWAIVQWGEALDLNADQLVGADGAKVSDARRAAPLRDECEQVLRELLADGPMRADEAIAKTREAVGCSAKPVKDASTYIGVIKNAVRIDGKVDHWTWELPPVVIKLPKMGGGSDE